MSAGAPTAACNSIAPLGWCLIALRLFAMAMALGTCLLLYGLAAAVTRHNPIPRLFLRLLGHICGLRVQIEGALAPTPRILLSNHVSWLDIPALAGTTGTAFVAHDGLASLGPLRWLCELNRTVFIARHNRASVAAQVQQVRDAMDNTGTLTIFPEGTTSDTLKVFKSSLLSALEDPCNSTRPIQTVHPVWLDYGADLNQIAWLGEDPGLSNAGRILARWKPVLLTLHVLPPLHGAQLSSRKAMAQAAHTAIAEAMAVQKTSS